MTSPRLVVVAGTGTEVGKTWVTAALVRELQARELNVAARKPAQSFAPGDESTDADVLGEASGASADVVCPRPRWYEVPMAPPMAADVLGRPRFTIADLVDELQWPDDVEVGLVETAGGVRSPLANDGDTVDLVAALRPDRVVLVADAGLGTINAVRLSYPPLAVLEAVTVFLNRYDADDDLHRRNRAWLEDDGIAVTADVADLAESVRGSGSPSLDASLDMPHDGEGRNQGVR